MPTLSKLKKTKPGKTKGGAIASAQRELLEKQSQIEAQIKALQASLEQAPAREAKPARSGQDRFAGAVPARGHYTHRTTVARQVTVIPRSRRPGVPRPGKRRCCAPNASPHGDRRWRCSWVWRAR